jgi:uncharacterized protein (DUF736 family)
MAGRNIGAMWKPKQESKAALTGSIELLGMNIRIAMFKNTDENKKENSPDYKIVSYGIDLPKESKPQESQPAQDGQDLPF